MGYKFSKQQSWELILCYPHNLHCLCSNDVVRRVLQSINPSSNHLNLKVPEHQNRSVKVWRPTRGFPHGFSITASLPVKWHQKSEVTCDFLFIKPLGKSQGYLCKPDSHSVAFSESFLGGRKALLLCVPESETSQWISFLTHDTGRKIFRDLLAFYSYTQEQKNFYLSLVPWTKTTFYCRPKYKIKKHKSFKRKPLWPRFGQKCLSLFSMI